MPHREKYLFSNIPEVLVPKPETKIDPDGYKIVSVRLREAEFEAFSEEVRGLGLTNNFALRVAARRIAGFLEVDRGIRNTLENAVSEIGNLSDNIAKLATNYRESGDVDMEAFAKARAEFGRQFAKLDTQLAEILNVSRRRVDGRERLRDAVNAS